jgi:hypothetical protein
MTAEELRAVASDPVSLRYRAFEFFVEVARLAATPGAADQALAQELVIRALEYRQLLGAERRILDALVRQRGLFPYLDHAELGIADALAYEAHRPLDLADPNVVFHAVQARAYHALLAGEDVVLMAPTSFGKTLIVDALIASGRYDVVVVVVPTIALIDETRVRLSRSFRDAFKVVTHPGQQLGERNLIVMTQERILELDEHQLPRIDLLVIDEFYKLDPQMDPDRAGLLNQAFHRLRRRARQFYLLGPSVRGLSPRLPADFAPRVISTNFRTVALDVERITVPKAERPARLVEICRDHDGPTLIYCRAPAGCRRVGEYLEEAGIGTPRPALDPAAEWLRQHVHPDWIVPRLLVRGIGIHHAQMPRWLSQFIVRAFNAGDLDVLACTSTLIEGVNTTAKNVVIFENKIGPKDLDLFTFENISGRSGRMWQHFVGRVFHFFPRPPGELQTVDIPILSQPDDAPASMLLELADDELTSGSRARLQAINDQQLLPPEVLRAHPGVPPERQIGLAEELAEDPEFYADDLSWSGIPDGPQLRAACELIWSHLVVAQGKRNGIASGRQLAARLDRFRADPDVRDLVAEELEGDYADTADVAAESVMQFVRSWVDFEFPKLLRCLSDVQRVVLGGAGFETGDYTIFAAQAESLFAAPFLAMLDEYGIPLSVAQALAPSLGQPKSLDEVLEQLGAVDLDQTPLTPFERGLVAVARERL